MKSHCSTKKTCYPSKQEAEEALLDLHARNNYATGAGPRNVYQCDICGEFHFTSKGDINPRLENKEDLKRIERESEAYYWEKKLR